MPKGEPLTNFSGAINALAYDPKGKILASGISDNTIVLWDTQTLQMVGAPLSGHLNQVNSVTFSPDGTLLASASVDNTIILWDLASGQPLGDPLRSDSSSVTSLAFDPISRRLVSGTVGGNVILWDLDPESWIEKNCQRAGRNFTRGEWDLYFPGVVYKTSCAQWSEN
jgi:WD40 repeat protein